MATLTFDDEPIQYLAGIVLRPGNASAGRGAIGRPRWLLRALRRAFARTTLRIRLDGGFAGPKLLAFLDRAGVDYLVGLPGNARLDKRVRRLRGRARVLFRATGQSTALFGETRYAAKSWVRKRRVIMKAEVVQYPGRAPRDNPRFVVTNLPLAPEAFYAIYRQRGDVENRHKELKDSLGLGRTSCPCFLANQVRVLWTATAFILFQTLQQCAQGTACAGAQVATLRERLIKLAVWFPIGAPDRAAPAPRLPLARALASGGARGRCAGRLTAAPPVPAAHPTVGVVSLPGPAASGPPTHCSAAEVGPGQYRGRVDPRQAVNCRCRIHQGRATHVVRVFTNRSG